MFHKILIANRGEIACRVMETARKMGVQSVAVYSDADAGAKHVEMADQAVYIGGSAPADSYLRGDAIIQAALDTGAEAVHPGYGFLSENPEFVEAVVAAGLVFIGPNATAIRAMGLKDAAKVLMEKSGVPVVPGYHGSDQDDTVLSNEAKRIGYPVLIKAVAGGGGKGMRVVPNAAHFCAALGSARAEARTSFGNDAVLVEKYIQNPRHIEMQIFGDGQNAVHLYERDCSLQRRHQKVIEEAPAPGMTDEMRSAMGQAAVRAARAIGYSGAGTVEFIVDASNGLRADGFWFMEMNTRLQVEHPVTEAVTNVDLVEWQLRVAAGQGLPLTQDEITLTGHAFEARLYAENVPAGFLPATGTLTHLAFPADIRADSGVRAGDEISVFYDPMIAKVIAYGASRDSARLGLAAGLAQTEVAGLVTNLEFLRALTAHAGFAAGQVDTDLIARDITSLTAAAPLRADQVAFAALAAMDLLGTRHSGFHIWVAGCSDVTLEFDGQAIEIKIKIVDTNTHVITVDEQDMRAERRHGIWEISGRRAPAVFVGQGQVTLFDDATLAFTVIDPLCRAQAGAGGADIVAAPMPGVVRDILGRAGEQVAQGARLATLEAMKMEHAMLAPRDGVIAEILVNSGDQVESGAALIRLEGIGDDLQGG